MRFVKLVLLSVLCFGILIFLISLLLPSKAIVERSGVIDAPLATVYTNINNLHTWSDWNPWAASEAVKKIESSTPDSGEGAYYAWTGMQQGKPVSGKVTITKSNPEKGVYYDMEFNSMKPVKGAFELKPSVDGKGTAIQWRMETNVGMLPWWKLRGFLTDRLAGPQLEIGLTKLKNICEKK